MLRSNPSMAMASLSETAGVYLCFCELLASTM